MAFVLGYLLGRVMDSMRHKQRVTGHIGLSRQTYESFDHGQLQAEEVKGFFLLPEAIFVQRHTERS